MKEKAKEEWLIDKCETEGFEKKYDTHNITKNIKQIIGGTRLNLKRAIKGRQLYSVVS